MDGTIDVRFFGNGRHNLRPQENHVVRTKEYHDLTTRGGVGCLPPNKEYTTLGFVDDIEGSFVKLHAGGGMVLEIKTKCVDYIKPFKRKRHSA